VLARRTACLVGKVKVLSKSTQPVTQPNCDLTARRGHAARHGGKWKQRGSHRHNEGSGQIRAGRYRRRVSFFSDSAAGVAKPDRQLVVDQLAAATGGNRRSIGQARAVLLADGGQEPFDQAALRGEGRKDRRLAGADGVDAGDGRSEIRRPGGEGRRGICGMCWKDRISRFWILPPGRQPRLAGAKTAPGGTMELARSEDSGWVYTKPGSGVQNGNSG